MTARALRTGLLLVLLPLGCIKVPNRVKVSFCAQSEEKNHFGSGAAARSCCPGPPLVKRFGSATGPCYR